MTFDGLHEQAMDAADRREWAEASQLEQDALNAVPRDRYRTRAILAQSLHYLCIKARLFRDGGDEAVREYERAA